MSDVSIRPRRPEDDQRLVEIRNAIASDRPPTTVQEERYFVDSMPERAQLGYVVAERGEVVGSANWVRRIFTHEEGAFRLDILVDRTHWGTGIGRALYACAMEALAQAGATRIYAYLREDLPDAEAWAARRGFTRTGHGDRVSRLDVQNATLDKARDALKRAESSGIRVATLAELGASEALLRSVKELDDETSPDIPEEENYEAPSFEEWKSITLDRPGISPETFWIALDGNRPVGMAPLRVRSGGYAVNFYTAVARSYRGRGLASALKLQGIEWARSNGIRYLVTGNDPANKPMLAVNVSLGYVFLPRDIQVSRTLQAE
jgi:GNAT superfamily N-acetyltransferase